MKVRNKRDYAVDLAPAGRQPRYVDAGEVIEVDDELAAGLLDQPDNWEQADTKPKKDKAAERGGEG